MTRRHSFHTLMLGMLFGLFARAMPAAASQADLEAEVQSIFNDYRAKAQPIQQIVARIKWSGITDARLFDAIEAEFLSRYSTDTSSAGSEYLAWLVRCLAYSGSTKYQPTIEAALATAATRKVKRHSEKALQELPQFVRWNPVIAKATDAVPPADIAQQRVINMLESDEPELMRAGASTAIASYAHNRELTDLVRAQLLTRYRSADSNVPLADSFAWFCKVLAASGQSEYIAALQEVRANSPQPILQKWTGVALEQLQKR